MWYWWPFAFVAAGMFLALVASFVVAVVGRSANRELTEFMISTAFCAHGWPFLVVEKVGRRFLGPVLAWMMVFLLAAAQWAALLGGAWHVIHRRRTPMRGRAALWLALAMFAAAGSGMAVWFIT